LGHFLLYSPFRLLLSFCHWVFFIWKQILLQFIRSLPRQTRPLSFLAFSELFSGKYLRQLGWKSNRFHRVIF
jgi:hypothetical protein